MTLDDVKAIAYHFRSWAEKVGSRSDCSCMCARASFEIFDALRLQGETVEFCSNACHCFVLWYNVYGTPYLIDVTASQFSCDYPKVIVEKYHELPFTGNWWAIRKTTNKVDDIAKMLKKWPAEQKPAQIRHLEAA